VKPGSGTKLRWAEAKSSGSGKREKGLSAPLSLFDVKVINI
jgi:hypothetical protein